jgi:outer membrane lipoprotein-sorting protein
MRNWLGMSLASVLLVAAGTAARADEASPKAIIERAVKAQGGEEKLAKFNAHTFTEKGKFYGMGDGIDYEGKYAVQFPDKFKMEIQNFFVLVLDGDKGWMTMNGNTEELTGDKLKDQKEERYASWVSSLLPLLKDNDFTLAALPETRVADKPAIGVKVSRKDHRDVKLYFDKGTGMLVKMEHRAKDEQANAEVDEEVTISDYKDFDGAQMPTKIVMKRDGKLFVEAEVQDLKPAEKLDKSTFAKPQG